MKRFAKILWVLGIALCAQTNAWAIDVICRIQPGTAIQQVLGQLPDARILDEITAGQTYLLYVSSIPAPLPLGIEYIEVNSRGTAIPSQGFAIFTKTVTNSTADWYSAQPVFQNIGPIQALGKATGKQIVIADLNSAVDYGHPALVGHLIGGYDFVSGAASSGAALNQSSASFLDQSSASFLDQSSASFLDQSSASFLDQSSASFLDQSSASFLDVSNPVHGHGTLVAGILAAIAPDAQIMPLRVFDDSGNADDFNIAKAIKYAADNGAHVINMSFGSLQNSKTVKDAIEDAFKRGVILIASAGNSNTEAPQYPAGYEKVVSVAATTITDQKASFSNFGTSVAVSGPGANIISAYPRGHWAVVSGTSFAAPVVAAEAALFLSSRVFLRSPQRR